jgi:lysophospholipase L1-like esterase
MKTHLLAAFSLVCVFFQPVHAAEQCLVIGDSLTKEYELEFPALFPENPKSWDSRNWIELLHEQRNSAFDLGKWGAFPDPRLIGHEFNWAFPGATTSQIRSQLSNWRNFWWTPTLQNQIRRGAERVVIFAGGNDVDRYYSAIYNGASPLRYINGTRDNLRWIVDYVRRVRGTVPIVLVSVPHVGCTLDIQQVHPTDPVKTARVTAALDSLNAQLASFARQRNIAFVPGVYELTKQLISQPFSIGEQSFYTAADADAQPEYLFSGDGFHPNTCAHAKIAQLVLQSFLTRYPTTPATQLDDAELLNYIFSQTD